MFLFQNYILAMDYGPDLINNVTNQYIKAINTGFGLIRSDVTFVLNVLIIISMVWSGILWAFSDESVLIQFCRKVIYIGFFAWMIQNWQVLTEKMAWSFMQMGLKAGGFDVNSSFVSQPGDIAYLGYTTIQPLMDQIRRLTGPVAFFKNIAEILFLFLAVVGIMVAFCVITVQIVLALITFKLGTLASFILVPFAVLSKTSFIAERPLGWVVGSGIRLMVLTLVLGIGNGVFSQLKVPPGQNVTIYQAFCIMLASILLMVLSVVASKLSADLITGGPSLGVGTSFTNASSAVQMIGSTVGTAVVTPTVAAVRAAAALL